VKKVKISQKTPFLPIFTISKRATGRNGAVRFLYGFIDIMSKIKYLKFQSNSPNHFLDKWILNLIYYTKTAIFELKWFQHKVRCLACSNFFFKMLQNYQVKDCHIQRSAPFRYKNLKWTIFKQKRPFLGQKQPFLSKNGSSTKYAVWPVPIQHKGAVRRHQGCRQILNLLPFYYQGCPIMSF